MIGNLVANFGVFAPVLARHLDGTPDRSADLGRQDLRARDRYLLWSDGLSPVADDRRTGMYSLSRSVRPAPSAS